MTRRKKYRTIAIPVVIALAVLSVGWPQQSAVAIALTSIALMYVTLEYVLVTQENLDVTRQNLDLFRRQLQRQERVVLHFDLGVRDRSLRLRVSNLGLSNFLLLMARARKPDDAQFDCEMHRVVESGKTEEFSLPASLYKGESFDVDLEFGLEYLGLDGPGRTSPKCFNVSLGLSDEPVQVTDGLDSPWAVSCTKCKGLAFTNVYGLKTFEAAKARREKLAEDLAASCPNHQSEFLLTLEHVEQQREQRRKRQSL